MRCSPKNSPLASWLQLCLPGKLPLPICECLLTPDHVFNAAEPGVLYHPAQT